MTEHSGFLTYEVCFEATKVGFERFARAVTDLGLGVVPVPENLVSAHQSLQAGTRDRTVYVRATPGQAAQIDKALGASRIVGPRYKSPTVFDGRGTILPIYASAEDELADRKTPGAVRALADAAKAAEGG